MFCPNCGRPAEEGMRFCIYCGFKHDGINTIQTEATLLTSANTSNNTFPYFSNKQYAEQMRTKFLWIAIPIWLLGLLSPFPINIVINGIVIIISCCMPSPSYIELRGDTISGFSQKRKKFSINVQEVISITRGQNEITIYTQSSQYTVNCGNECDTIIKYINKMKTASFQQGRI